MGGPALGREAEEFGVEIEAGGPATRIGRHNAEVRERNGLLEAAREAWEAAGRAGRRWSGRRRGNGRPRRSGGRRKSSAWKSRPAVQATRIGRHNAEVRERNGLLEAAREAWEAARSSREALERAAVAAKEWVLGLARGLGERAAAERAQEQERAREAELARQRELERARERSREQERDHGLGLGLERYPGHACGPTSPYLSSGACFVPGVRSNVHQTPKLNKP